MQATNITEDSNILGVVELQPGAVKELILGMYEATMALPVLNLQFQAGRPEAVEAELITEQEEDVYKLIHRFRNTSNQLCTIVVRDNSKMIPQVG